MNVNEPVWPRTALEDEPAVMLSEAHARDAYHALDTAVRWSFSGSTAEPEVNISSTVGTAVVAGAIDLTQILGPRRQELYKVIPITVIYCIIFLTGLFGNVCTCVVVARNKYMQTATNLYLFNLAVADLLVLVLGLPQETYMVWSAYPWVFGASFCVIRTMAADTSTNASILTITAFTVERYVAICHPLRAQTMSSLSRAVKVILLIWLVAGICSIPTVVQFGVVYVNDANGQAILESAHCDIEKSRALDHSFEIFTFLFFFAPMTLISVLYCMIGLAIRRSALSRKGSDSSTHSANAAVDLRVQQQARARRAVLKMLVAVVVAFFICWAPFHTQRLVTVYLKKEQWTPTLGYVFSVLYYISGILYYVSSVINPILYNIMSLKFRQAFRNTVFRPCRRTKRQNTQRHLATYRFCTKPVTDSNTNPLLRKASPAHKNSPIFTFRGLRPPAGLCRPPVPSTSSNSASGGSHKRMLGSNDIIANPLDHIELDPMLIECKSLSCACARSSSYQFTADRPYHSFA